jgi:hypothetical protein
MSKPSPLKRLVVVSRNSSDHFKTAVSDGLDPRLELENDVLWHSFEILLGPPAQADRADHDESVHPSGVHLRTPPKKLNVANCDLKLIALDMVLSLN